MNSTLSKRNLLGLGGLLVLGALAPAKGAEQAPAQRDLVAESQNLALVTRFYNEVFNAHRLDNVRSVVSERYRQHNPRVPDGLSPFLGFFTKQFQDFPQSSSRIVHSGTSEDLVFLHVHQKVHPEDLGTAIVDIFRVENGLIVEHWDVLQPVPAAAANTNTMF